MAKGISRVQQPKPTLRLHGNNAREFFGSKPGQKVSVRVQGRLMSTGLSEYGQGHPPEAIIEIRKTTLNPIEAAKKK